MGLKDFLSKFKGKGDTDTFSETHSNIQPKSVHDTDTVGVILTSTGVIADKYYSCAEENRQAAVKAVIQKFQEDSESIGNTWLLCDVSDYDYIFKDDDSSLKSGGVTVSEKVVASWQFYALALQDFCAGMGLQTTAKTPLLIVGGDDVIPVPIEEVEFDLLGENGKTEHHESMPHVDMKYCFPLDFDLFKELEKEKLEKEKRPFHNISESILEKAKFNVARIPLESGRLGTKVWEDLGGYFDKVIASGKSVKVNSAVACAAENLAPGMIEDITHPLPLVDDNIKFSGQKVFISPPVDLEQNTTMNTVYKEAVSNADLFISNLHGSDKFNTLEYLGRPVKGGGYWYSENGRDCDYWPKAFLPYLTLSSKLKVILSLACYGARYIEYPRDVSTLLTAMYNSGVLLFMGSSQIAWGAGEGWDGGRPSCSDSLMQIYIDALMEGDSAGYALLKAKLDYFYNNYSMDAKLAYLTIVEFNLFGDPTLHIEFPPRSRQSFKTAFSTSVNTKKGPYTGAVSYKTVYSSGNSDCQNNEIFSRGSSINDIYERLKNKNDSINSIYNQVHYSVNAALREIEERLMTKLFGTNSRDTVKLKKIEEIYVNGASNGYCYLFENGGGSFKQQTIAFVDKNGNIINSMCTK